MDILEFRAFCLDLKGTEETMPFDDKTLVFKVMGKMFALTSIVEFKSINLKCDPEKALELRAKHQFVRPGYHMSKKHWNTVDLVPELEESQLKKWTLDSYNLVVSGLTKKNQALLESM
ncbi:MAG: MmcQ/YjbR family DNA-binding protein [Flavobacteriales bacterium]